MNEILYRLVGLKISFIRETVGFTQEELAKKIGLTRTSLTNIEAGKQRILMHTLEEIAKGLGTTPKHILKGIWL
mgnify:FL=1